MASSSTSLCKELQALRGGLELCRNARFVLASEKPSGAPRGLLEGVCGQLNWRQPVSGKGTAPAGRVQPGSAASPVLLRLWLRECEGVPAWRAGARSSWHPSPGAARCAGGDALPAAGLCRLVSRARRGLSAGEPAGFAAWQLRQHFLGSWWLLTPLRIRQDGAERCPDSFFAERGWFAQQQVCQPNLGALAWSHPESFSSLLWRWIF